jgi:TolB protein
MILRWVRSVMVVVLLGVAPPASAVVTGSIFGPGTATIPIAVVPVDDQGGARQEAARFAEVLQRDLELSGYFQQLAVGTFPERPPSLGLTAAETDFPAWQLVGAQAVVKGAMRRAGGELVADLHMFDVGSRTEIAVLSRRLQGQSGDVARMAHRYADRILEHLTGTLGPFDSEIVFTSTRGGGLKSLYGFDFDGGQPRRLTDDGSLTLAPRWHPSGRRILFTSYREHVPRLFDLDLGTGRVRRALQTTAVLLNGAWSPDGSMLLVSREMDGNSDIYLLDRSGTVLRRLTDHWSIDVSPAWAPDGRRFAFCSARAGAPQIYTMNIDGTGLQRVSYRGTYNTSPSWAPVGDRIAYVTREAGFQVVVVGADGTGARTITQGGTNEDPSWAPDGRYLVFSGRRGGRRSLVFTDREGRFQKELTTGRGDDTSPAWSARRE